MNQPGITRCGNIEFHWGKRTYVMGIINMSLESFSSDGLPNADSALEQARRFVNEGADILDVGGESTRPGLASISVDDELNRVIPVIERLSREISVPISIDTTKMIVAEQALKAGAVMLNDQWGLKTEPRLAELAAIEGVPIVLMSNQRDKGEYDVDTGRDTSRYEDVMGEVKSTLRQSVESAIDAGVPPENIIIDPGIGFGKAWQQDLEIMRRLSELRELGKPILIGTSRKSLIKQVLNLPAGERVEGTAATVAIGIANGADIVRVHDVREMVRVCRMSDAIVRVAPR
ncbi:MAG: dihydropteroate synthase [Dehalococcoidales bacterium]|nr:MAG: dihydropteroate synthase [Dehalococcoidales bacterium]